MKNCLVLVQYRENSEYNDFLGKFYHFPANEQKSYLKQFEKLPVEFVYYEPTKNGGKGEYYGCGKITKRPFADKRVDGHFFVELSDYTSFTRPVSLNDEKGNLRESNNPHYNAGNSVRKIPSEIFDEICMDGEVQLSFQSDAHLIRVLGEQLISSEKVGILELIKNAYDAHAENCIVRIENSPNLHEVPSEHYLYPELPGPVIIIRDDGDGMDRQIIENGWLRPASTIKTNVKSDLELQRREAIKNGTLGSYEEILNALRQANKNRIPLGEKGVGRFATHRLGRKLFIKTKRKGDEFEYLLKIDWDDFDEISDQHRNLNDIGVVLTRQKPSREYPKGSGTEIVIYQGRDGFDWSVKKIEDLNESIVRLNSPNPNPELKRQAFNASLEVPQIPDLQNDPHIEIPPVFVFTGVVDDKGNLSYDLDFKAPKNLAAPMVDEEQRGEVNLKTSNEKYNWEKREFTECGQFYFHLKLWYRDGKWMSGPNAKSFKDRLDRYGGISIYRDGINIFPAEWGSQNDWLGLKQEQIKQTWRFSYYSMLGNVEIDQGLNVGLSDKTNREGLIENLAYTDFVALMQAALNVVLNEWKAKRDKYNDLTKDIVREPKMLRDFVKVSHNIHKETEERYPVEKDPFEILTPLASEGVERVKKLTNLRRSLNDMHDSLGLIAEQQDLLTEQAGYGLAIASSVHEINKITSNFFYGINAIIKKGDLDEAKLKRLLDSSSSLRTELKRLSPLRAVRSENKTQFNVTEAIKYALSIYEDRFEEKGIAVNFDFREGFNIRARYGAMVQIFTNLFENALYWIETDDKLPHRIEIQLDEEHKTVVVADSGPGIHQAMLPHLFKAGYSMKIPRSGLGLYISRYYMQEIKGDLQLLQNRKFQISELEGAQFLLDFANTPEA